MTKLINDTLFHSCETFEIFFESYLRILKTRKFGMPEYYLFELFHFFLFELESY